MDRIRRKELIKIIAEKFGDEAKVIKIKRREIRPVYVITFVLGGEKYGHCVSHKPLNKGCMECCMLSICNIKCSIDCNASHNGCNVCGGPLGTDFNGSSFCPNCN